MVKYDGTVRNQNEQIIQLLYGEDGLDGSHLEFQKVPTMKLANRPLEKKFRFDPTVVSERQLRRCLAEPIVKDIQSDTSIQSSIEDEWLQIAKDRTVRSTLPCLFFFFLFF